MNFIEEVNSYEDICKILNIDPNVKPDTSAYDNEDRSAAVSLFRLWKASKAAWKAEKKVIDWNDWEQKKYSIWAELSDDAGSGSGFSSFGYYCVDDYSSVGARLVFPSLEIAKHIFEFMKEDFKNVMKYPN